MRSQILFYFSKIKYYYVYSFRYLVGGLWRHSVDVCKSEGSLYEWVLSLHHVGPKDSTQVFRPSGIYLDLLNHFTNPNSGSWRNQVTTVPPPHTHTPWALYKQNLNRDLYEKLHSKLFWLLTFQSEVKISLYHSIFSPNLGTSISKTDIYLSSKPV